MATITNKNGINLNVKDSTTIDVGNESILVHLVEKTDGVEGGTTYVRNRNGEWVNNPGDLASGYGMFIPLQKALEEGEKYFAEKPNQSSND